MSGPQAGSFGPPAMHNPAFLVDQGKYGTFANGSVYTLLFYNYSFATLYNPNAVSDNPIWLYSATFTPKDYSAKTIEIRVETNYAKVGVYVPTWPPWPPNPYKNAPQSWTLTLKPGFIVVTPASCQADCDSDNLLTIDDFICFQTLYAIGDPKADCDSDGQLLIDDFICFQTAYAIGC